MAGHGPERADFDPRRGHREVQIADPLLLGGVSFGPYQAEDHVRFLGGAGPDLLAVDDEFVALDPAAGLVTGEVRSRTGLGIALARTHFTRPSKADPDLRSSFGAKY